MIRTAPLIVIALAATLAVGACSEPNGGQGKPSPRPSTMTVGQLTDVPGTGTLDISTHARTGFGPDLMSYLADSMKFTPSVVDVTFGDRIQMIKSGKVNVMIANFAITDDRKKWVTFAGPYMKDRQDVLDRKTDEPIRRVEDLAHKTVCTEGPDSARDRTTSLGQLKEHEHVTITSRDGVEQCVDALRNGDVSAVWTDRLDLLGFAKKYPDLRLEQPFGGYEDDFGIGLPKGDLADCRRFTAQIRTLLSTDRWDTIFKDNYPGEDPKAHKPDPNSLDDCE